MPSLTTPEHIAAEWGTLSPAQRLVSLRRNVAGRLVFTTSFGAEDQALTHIIADAGLDIELATLDTGRLFPETYDVWAATELRYGLRIRGCYPQQSALASYVGEHGINGLRDNVQARKECCAVRKVEPLRRALLGAVGWITGLRADQSDARQSVPWLARDDGFGLLKANPLRDWSRDQVSEFLDAHDVPRNVLHAQGFVSIGCAPCTRAIAPGESERAGRWWWEASSKECGLHVGPDGRLVRAQKQTEQVA
ncbi:MAG: phosphoadenylyl-sulfate reductase [Acetobacteraceae bacterium]|nr:phosphoadenylyl-sulfate reductase [Acetobacteraceae bacterium]